MRSDLLWIIVLIMTRALASPLPPAELAPPPPRPPRQAAAPGGSDVVPREEGEVISVRITSSVAVDRGPRHYYGHGPAAAPREPSQPSTAGDTNQTPPAITATEAPGSPATRLPLELEGANIEYIKQLNAKKDARGLHSLERAHPYHVRSEKPHESEDSAIEESVKSILEIPLNNNEDLYSDVPQARSVPPGSQKNYIHTLPENPSYEGRNSPRLTTVSFNVVHHSTPIVTPNYEPGHAYTASFSTPEHFYSEPTKVYSQPAKVYSEPAKFYSEPAKVYSEPAKVYGEPAKVYGEPAKVYGEPAKFYSQPASLHLEPAAPSPPEPTPSTNAPPLSTSAAPANATQRVDHQPEKNYEIDEKVSVMTDGRRHGVQDPGENCKQDNCKVGYVVEGRQYRKYRVEERTPDGFLVGEYGVVRNEDGALRGVRYTADSDASPRLIYDALMKFLQLK